MIDLSICITTLNASYYLRDCLRSISEQSSQLHWVDSSIVGLEEVSGQSPLVKKLDIELIIVDNGSTNDTVSMLHNEFPTAQLIQNGRNDGFARPYNQAMRQSQGR